MNLNSGAGLVFSRPITFNGREYSPGEAVPAGIDEKKLRFLQASKRIQIGFPSEAAPKSKK